MGTDLESAVWPEDGLSKTFEAFNSKLIERKKRGEIHTRYAHDFFAPVSPERRRGTSHALLKHAWVDEVDVLLAHLVPPTFKYLMEEAEWDNKFPRPIAGAVARYEPVFGKVSHYFFPSEKKWNDEVIKGIKISEHMRKLQEEAKFSLIPDPDVPEDNAGLIPLLEHMALYPDQAPLWANRENNLAVKQDELALIVEDLKSCRFISDEGAEHYEQDRGCILFPFVAHDKRLVGHGLVVFDQKLPLRRIHLMGQIAKKWREVFETTFAPLVSNFNSAAMSGLDGFFLGRIQGLRHRMGGRDAGQNHSPPRDLLVLNKMALYELINALLNVRGKPFYIAFFDIDNFKSVNEALGHQQADVLLFHIARELSDLLAGPFRPTHDRWLGRFGGDEFVGVAPGNVHVAYLSRWIGRCFESAVEQYNKENGDIPWAIFDKEKGEYLRDNDGILVPRELTTSIGWVHSMEATRAKNASGLSEEFKKKLGSMRPEYALIELADTEAQEWVKGLGKSGFLDFDRRRNNPTTPKKMTEDLKTWLKEIVKWIGHHDRKVTIELTHKPPQARGK